MFDYKKTDFYHCYDSETDTRRYFIKVYGTFIEVSKEVYYACYNSYRKQLRDMRRDKKYGVFSYDSQFPNGNSILETFGEHYDYLDQIYKKDLLNDVMDLINDLTDEDKKLVSALLLENKKERELAEKHQVSQQMISRKKKRILKNLQENLKSGVKKLKALLFM